VAQPDGTVHRYAKIHPFSFAGEHERYAAGTDFLTVRLDGLRVSVFVCYDLRFADEFWGLAGDTDLYVVPANWPQPRHEHWRALLRARAIENQAYVLGVNRVGAVADLPHAGGSALLDPLGQRLFEGDADERVLLGDVDPATVEGIRTKYPFLADRRHLTKAPSRVY
jgi:predicted amidohydrolase